MIIIDDNSKIDCLISSLSVFKANFVLMDHVLWRIVGENSLSVCEVLSLRLCSRFFAFKVFPYIKNEKSNNFLWFRLFRSSCTNYPDVHETFAPPYIEEVPRSNHFDYDALEFGDFVVDEREAALAQNSLLASECMYEDGDVWGIDVGSDDGNFSFSFEGVH